MSKGISKPDVGWGGKQCHTIKVGLRTFLEIQVRYYVAGLPLKKTLMENPHLPSPKRSVLQQDVSRDSVRNLTVRIWRGKTGHKQDGEDATQSWFVQF